MYNNNNYMNIYNCNCNCNCNYSYYYCNYSYYYNHNKYNVLYFYMKSNDSKISQTKCLDVA